jgi:hypothetical protein
MKLESFSLAIPPSGTPVLLVAGIGALMNVIYAILAWIVNTVRAGKALDEQLHRSHHKLMKLTIGSIELLAATPPMISAVVAATFFPERTSHWRLCSSGSQQRACRYSPCAASCAKRR